MAKRYLFPEVLSITLYKYNSLDSKLYTLILDNCKFKKHKNTILVRKLDVNSLMQTYFKNELDKLPLIPVETLHKEANSIYFLDKIIKEMPNLRWFQIQYSKNVKFTRITINGDGGEKTLNFVSNKFSPSNVLGSLVNPFIDPFHLRVPPALKKYLAASTLAKVYFTS